MIRWRKLLVATVAVFGLQSGLGYLIHGLLLGDEYDALRMFRDFDHFAERLPFLYLANLLFAGILCFIFTRAFDPDSPWAVQGAVYGALMGGFLIPGALIAYVALPLPEMLVLKITVLTFAQVVASGVVVAAIYRH